MQKECKRIIATMLFCLLMSVSLPAAALDSQTDADSGDIVDMLAEELKLTQDQTDKLKPEIDTFVTTIDRLKADQEKEDADPEALVKGAKKAQEEYLRALKKILTPQQYDQYNAIKEKAVRGMFNDLAEIQLMDLQPKVGFNDDQLAQLVPILGDALFEVVKIAWEHAGKQLRIGQKIRIAKHLKHIQKDSREAVSKVLTPEQLEAWGKIKEQASQQ
jgi:Spy/CpxP family protein refolding chaperone